MITLEKIEDVARAAWRAAVGETEAEPHGHPVYETVKAELADEAEAPVPMQEYPKWVGDRIVQNAEEEAALTAPEPAPMPDPAPMSADKTEGEPA